MPKISEHGATYAGAEGIVEHADGRLSNLDGSPVQEQEQEQEQEEEQAEEGERPSRGNSSAASSKRRGSSASKS
jgi:hypothetical protein